VNPFVNPFVPSPFFLPTTGSAISPGMLFPNGPNTALTGNTATTGLFNDTLANPGLFVPGNPFGLDSFFFNPFLNPFGVTSVAPNANTVLGPPTPALPTRSNLPLLGINTPAHTAGGGPVPYVHTKAAIVAPPVSPDEAVHPLGESQR